MTREPRVKPSLRRDTPSAPRDDQRTPTRQIMRRTPQPRGPATEQRRPAQSSSKQEASECQRVRRSSRSRSSKNRSRSSEGSDSSELTPEPDEGERGNAADRQLGDYQVEEDSDEGEEEEISVEMDVEMTPRKRKADGTPSHPRSADKGKGRADQRTVSVSGGSGMRKKVAGGNGKVTITGPAGRDRRKALKVGERERRRARDEKFGLGGTFGGSTPRASSHNLRAYADSDATSSYGDDESDHGHGRERVLSLGLGDFNGFETFGHETEDDQTRGLPEAFAGQEIEDLAYGAGPAEAEVEREALAGLWDEEDEDEEMLIARLSGSEAERQSQSSVHASDSDDSMSDSDISDSTEDGVDEFGFPAPGAQLRSDESGQGPLVLMENWDGQFVLVQPRQERSRSRKDDRGSRTAGSVSGSTIISNADQDQQGLLIDPDAVGHEFDEPSSDSEWSGVSDEEDGDTTDSMAEEDMPMLDSPALQELIDQQVGPVSAISPMPMGMEGESTATAPAIVITDTTAAIPETPALSTSSSGTPALVGPTAVPQTPVSTACAPMMGTFMPSTNDPAQHAVIDGSKTATKSPFTHGRRSRKGRAGSMSSAITSGTLERERDRDGLRERERKRRSHSQASTSMDPFAPTPRTLPKRARYSSIPGHPRFVAAQRAAFLEREETSEEDDGDGAGVEGIELEDMLETSGLLHEYDAASHGMGVEDGETGHLRHLIRFDRVPVSTYLKRNLASGRERYPVHHTGHVRHGHGHGHQHGYGPHGAGYEATLGAGLGVGMGYGGGGGRGARDGGGNLGGFSVGGRGGQAWSSPVRGRGVGVDETLTLAGPMGRMLVSPVLVPVREERRGRMMEGVEI